MTKPKINKNNTPAPKYQGPDVKGLSPQYTGIRLAISAAWTLLIPCAPKVDIKNLATFDFSSKTPLDPPP
ncbi:hypothetical protein D3C86_1271220 [compost metagenome]